MSSAFSGSSDGATPAASVGTVLTGPATLSYGGSPTALLLTQSGTGRALSASVTDTGSGSSALYGDTVGSGAGLTGYNLGTAGPGGKFEVTNAHSAQAGSFGSTNGTGPAILGPLPTRPVTTRPFTARVRLVPVTASAWKA
jgi:hypothetical protein